MNQIPDFDFLETRFLNLNKSREATLKKFNEEINQVESTIAGVEKIDVERRLNIYRQVLIDKCETAKRDSLEAFRMNSKNRLLLNTNLHRFRTQDLVGQTRIKNEFELKKKLYFINLYDFVREIKLISESQSDYQLIDVIFISSDIIFYHFKSLDYHSDKLVESDAARTSDHLKQIVMKYDGIGFSNYFSQGVHILACLNDFKRNYFELALYNRDFVKLASRKFDSVITLSLASKDEIICYVPHQYLVFNYKLEMVDSFSKSLDLIDLGPGRFSILSDSSRCFFYFKFIDENNNQVLIKFLNAQKIVDKKNHKLFREIKIDADDFFKVDYHQEILYIKNIFMKKIRVLDVHNDTEFVRSSSRLANFYFVSISQDGHLYSVNYLSNKIVYI